MAEQLINALVPGITIEEGELQRFGPVTTAVGEAEKTVKTFGPFTMSLLCEDNAGNVRVRVQVATNAANSIFQSDLDDEDDFDPDDLEEDILDNTNGTPGVLRTPSMRTTPSGPGGTPVFNGAVNAAANFGGGNCWVSGYVLEVPPI